jgi:putative Mg2+ transporter-C (MgtC) family protein
MPIALEAAAINLAVALGCGALIGSERQIRQRLAGLRTNALVALGSAAFVVFAALFPDEISPTRVAAQIVSGIGFLGAGIIFRDGFNVHGLNTAATLWCSASAGMLAGAGAWDYAAVMTGFVIFTNLGLRPLVKWIKARTRSEDPLNRLQRLQVVCPVLRESEVRVMMLQLLDIDGVRLVDIILRRPDGDTAELTAQVLARDAEAARGMERVAARLAAEPGLSRVSWQSPDDG